jgi:outer membrane protein OmpA-like peptidoglycan-associated protein
MHHRWPNSLIFRHPFAAALVVAVLLNTALTNPVQSQSQSGVFVDLSVLNDSGASYGAFGTARSGLIVPPKFAPKSTLHLAPKTKVKLKRPGAGQSMTKKSMPSTPKESVKSAAMKKPMAKAPAAKMAAIKTTAVKKPMAMKPAPKKAEKMAKSAPPPPPAKTPTAPPAPTKKAPPPPAVSTTPPPAAPSATAATGATETASVPTAIDIKPGQALRINFADIDTKLIDANKPSLLALATAMQGKTEFRLQLLAYAGGKDLSTSKARRMSLSRALSVRSFLIDNGIRSTQIDVRALGNKTTEKPINRVDVNLARR